MPEPFPAVRTPLGARRLCFQEREEISCRRAAGEGVRAIARALGRSPSTVSRELRRGTVRRKSGYRASVAQAVADQRPRRPKTRMLALDDGLQARTNRLLPGQPERSMAARSPVSDNPACGGRAIYRSLVRGRGGLRQELVKCLRTGQALQERRTTERRGRMAGRSALPSGRRTWTARCRGRGKRPHHRREQSAIGTSWSAPPTASCSCLPGWRGRRPGSDGRDDEPASADPAPTLTCRGRCRHAAIAKTSSDPLPRPPHRPGTGR